MRWFKHMTDMHSDAFVVDLMEEFGLEGYGAYCILLEIYGRECGVKPGQKLEFSYTNVRRKFRKSSTFVRKFLYFCSINSKLLITFSEKKFNLEVPKMLELRDNHTRNLQVTNKLVSPNKEEEKEESKNKRKSPPISPTGDLPGKSISQVWFEQFWEAYPRKVSKSDAAKKFPKLCQDPKTFEAIMTGLKSYKQSDNWTKDNGQFIPHPSTWLNQRRWEDEIPEAGEFSGECTYERMARDSGLTIAEVKQELGVS